MTRPKASGAPEVTNWGTGTPRRELLHVDDLAGACLYLLEHFDGPTQVNVGTGIDHTISEIADMVAAAVGYDWRNPLGFNQTGRNTAQIAGRFIAPERGMAARDHAARRHRVNGGVVSRERGRGAAMIARPHFHLK